MKGYQVDRVQLWYDWYPFGHTIRKAAVEDSGCHGLLPWSISASAILHCLGPTVSWSGPIPYAVQWFCHLFILRFIIIIIIIIIVIAFDFLFNVHFIRYLLLHGVPHTYLHFLPSFVTQPLWMTAVLMLHNRNVTIDVATDLNADGRVESESQILMWFKGQRKMYVNVDWRWGFCRYVDPFFFIIENTWIS